MQKCKCLQTLIVDAWAKPKKKLLSGVKIDK